MKHTFSMSAIKTKKKGMQYIIAIEGGGSHCRSVLYDVEQYKTIQKYTLNKPANIARDREATLDAIEESISFFAKICGTDAERLKQSSEITLCLPGVSNDTNVRWLKKQLKAELPVHVVADVTAGLIGAHGGLHVGCGLLIGGTGSIAVGLNDDEEILRIAGRGDPGELCSGYALGKKALQTPELLENTAFRLLCKQVATEHGLQQMDATSTPHNVVAKLAPGIFDLAETEENGAARRLLDAAAGVAAEYVKSLHENGIFSIGIMGSVAHRLLPSIKQCLAEECVEVNIFEVQDSAGTEGALLLGKVLAQNPSHEDQLAVQAMQPIDVPSADVCSAQRGSPRKSINPLKCIKSKN